ncbi:hypothetical protein AALF16_23700 [Bacillus cereus]|uniref:hypothetical protein n=1 Tax=Bacillus cereus TaxID=1396 RepID=UPI00356C045D
MKRMLFLVPFLFLTACGGEDLANTRWEKVEGGCSGGGLGDSVSFHEKNKATMDGKHALSYEKVSDNEYIFTNGRESLTLTIEQKGNELKVGSLKNEKLCTYKQVDR